MSISRTIGAAFWQDQARRFGDVGRRALEQSDQPLAAGFHPDGWGVEHLKSFTRMVSNRWLLERAPYTFIEDFKTIGSLCAVALGAKNSDSAWVEWLEYLRSESADFEPLAMARKSWSKEPRATEVESAHTRELFHGSSEHRDFQLHTVHIGAIDDVCSASERACTRLADEALRLELSCYSKEPVGGPADPRTVFSDDTPPTPEARAARRTLVLDAILKRKALTPSGLATVAGVDPSVVYDYRAGRSNPRPDSRRALEEALGVESLPE